MADTKTPHASPEHPENAAEGGRSTGGPLGVILPPDQVILSEARKLIADKNVRVEDVSTCASQDPVIVLELLKSANAMFFSAGRPPITSPKTAIVRLGQQVVQELFDTLKQRGAIEAAQVSGWLEAHRSRCKRAAIVARMLAEVVIKNFSDECQVAGLLAYIGEMIAVAHLREDYVKLADEMPRSAVNYRLAQEHKFDVEKIGLGYLRRNGIPEIILFALDREALSRAPERAAMKPVIMASDEMVESFDGNRWDKLAPGKQLPSKSALRLLQISDAQYAKIYERASEYLFSMRIVEEKKKQRLQAAPEGESISIASSHTESWGEATDIGSSGLQSEIESLLSSLESSEPVPEAPARKQETIIQKTAAPEAVTKASLDSEFGIGGAAAPKPARVSSPARAKVEPPRLANNNSTKVVSSIASAIDSADNSEELLRELLGMLVGPGLFAKSALIVVAKDKKKAIVVAARGPDIGNGQTLIIDDPLNPLAECFSKVQSFGNKESKASPFGSRAFAVAPIDAPHDTPVALYADCGNEGAVPFEARRIFRNVVDILNQKLPYLPGSIPVEI